MAKQKTLPAYVPAGKNPIRRAGSKYSIRLWVITHSRFFEWFYTTFASVLLRLHWFWNFVGYHRAERPVVFVEKHVKSFLFDCRMCGQCVLSSTGMSCPMNCPKELRNGPCGGVRANGNCEIEKDMPCVWVQAWRGSQSMVENKNITKVQKPINNSLRGSSAWLRATAEAAEAAGKKMGKATK